jgi:hypothetical protein
MSQSCAIPKCERTSRGLCDCCKQNLCLQHLNEHNALQISQLNPLIDEINALGDRLKSFNIHEAVSNSRQKLEKWQKDCHEKIDYCFQKKCQELDCFVAEKLNSLREKIVQMQSKVAKFIREQETTRQDIETLTSNIRQLQEDISKIEQRTVQISTRSLKIDDSFVQVRDIDKHKLDLSTLSPVYRSFSIPVGSSIPVTCNDQFLLIHQKPNLCLISREMKVEKQVLWEHQSFRDMCWSSILDQFIIIDNDTVFLFDERTMSIQNIETIEKRRWASCTCSDASLFLSTRERGSSIVEIKLSPSIAIIKEWKSPTTCTKDERIHGTAHNSGTCAIIIRNYEEESMRIELRSCETLDRLWSFSLDIIANQKFMFRCCALFDDGWLVADYESKRLLQVTKDGELKTTTSYNTIPYCAKLFTSDMLAVFTPTKLNIHKI